MFDEAAKGVLARILDCFAPTCWQVACKDNIKTCVDDVLDVVFGCLLLPSMHMSDTKVSKTVFKDNQSTSFFISRGQKIASAIYLVTELFDEREPLRWSLRCHVLEFIDDVSRNSSTASGRLTKMLFMIETAARVRILSEMNRDILVSEIRSFADAFDAELKGRINADVRTLSDIFQETKELPQTSYQSSRTPYLGRHMFIKGHSTGPIKDIQKDIIKTDTQKKVFSGKDRKEKIINIIREKGEVTIKDIALTIPECSEKTIQRDLVELVISGDIKKKGERRWTTYFL